jgi:hypothetical protein
MSTEIHKILTRHWYASAATSLSASITVMDSITLATGDYFLGDDIIIRGTWTFSSTDTIDNSVIFGYSTGTSAAIVNQITVSVPKGTGLPLGTSYGCFSRVIRITGALSAGTTLYFLAQLTSPPLTSSPNVNFEGTVSY